MGPFVYDVQGFQVTFTETVATRYELSAARDGVASWQINGTLHYVNATAAALHVPECSLQLGSGFSVARLAAGQTGDVLVFGKDIYGVLRSPRHCLPKLTNQPCTPTSCFCYFCKLELCTLSPSIPLTAHRQLPCSSS
jgi:hypothetical protein